MSYSVYDLKDFYSRRGGRLVRRLISSHIGEFWDDVHGLEIMGYGYAVPYLHNFLADSAKSVATMPLHMGVHAWHPEGKGLVSFAKETELPFETESLDRILVVHGLEYAEDPEKLVHEFWRVLKSNGRLLMVVPNRLGMWARADWTPLGHGMPYSMGQIQDYLQKNMFVIERRERGLFMPPFRSFLVLRTAYTMESFGRFIFPGLAGVHLIEASKQVYAGVKKVKEKERKLRTIVVGEAVPT